MKFQSIFHYILLIVVIRNGDAQQSMIGSLSTDENAYRLANCGKDLFGLPATDSRPAETHPADWPPWLLLLINTKRSLGTMISPRHFLTSSEVVLYDNKTWRGNGQPVSTKCIDGTGHLLVPTEFLQTTKFYKPICQNANCTWPDKPIARAVILNYCTVAQNLWDMTQAVMVVEIESDPGESWPCLIDNIAEKNVLPGHILDIFTLVGMSDKAEHRRLNIKKSFKEQLWLPPHHEIDHRGNPILWKLEDRWWLIGLGAGGSQDTSYGLKVSNLEKELCDLVGICGPGQIPVAPPPVVPGTPPPPPLSIQPPPAEIFIPTESPVPPPVVPQPSPPAQTPDPMLVPTPATIAGMPSNQPEAAAPPPTPPPEPSPKAPPPRAPSARRGKEDEEKDDEYEMDLKRKKEKEDAAMYEDEDTDILISKDDYWFSGIDRCGGLGRCIILLCIFWFLLFV